VDCPHQLRTFRAYLAATLPQLTRDSADNKRQDMSAFRGPRQKIFVIGNNKTGTTSIGAALEALGFSLGNQADAELLMEDWAKRDFQRIVDYCETADAFQDVPFSLEFTYQVLDYAFPDSRFILTVRNS